MVVTVYGFDDLNMRGGTVSLRLPAHNATELTAAELEAGPQTYQAIGALGDGNGKWRLFVHADQPIHAMSLLYDPYGYLTNLSVSRKTAEDLEILLAAYDLGDDPDVDRIDDVNLTLPAQCVQEVEVCVRDHECEDGDEVRVTVNDRIVFEGELFNRWQCAIVPVDEGTNSISFLALNGTGFKGPCSYQDVNTGELRVRARGGQENLQSWRHAGGRGSRADLNITVGSRSEASCSLGSDPDDHSDTISGATDLLPGSSQTGELTRDDVDVFRVPVSQAGTLTVYTTGGTDTVGRLLDNSGVRLTSNDDGGEGTQLPNRAVGQRRHVLCRSYSFFFGRQLHGACRVLRGTDGQRSLWCVGGDQRALKLR